MAAAEGQVMGFQANAPVWLFVGGERVWVKAVFIEQGPQYATIREEDSNKTHDKVPAKACAYPALLTYSLTKYAEGNELYADTGGVNPAT